jgi:hypothetical protein
LSKSSFGCGIWLPAYLDKNRTESKVHIPSCASLSSPFRNVRERLPEREHKNCHTRLWASPCGNHLPFEVFHGLGY